MGVRAKEKHSQHLTFFLSLGAFQLSDMARVLQINTFQEHGEVGSYCGEAGGLNGCQQSPVDMKKCLLRLLLCLLWQRF